MNMTCLAPRVQMLLWAGDLSHHCWEVGDNINRSPVRVLVTLTSLLLPALSGLQLVA